MMLSKRKSVPGVHRFQNTLSPKLQVADAGLLVAYQIAQWEAFFLVAASWAMMLLNSLNAPEHSSPRSAQGRHNIGHTTLMIVLLAACGVVTALLVELNVVRPVCAAFKYMGGHCQEPIRR